MDELLETFVKSCLCGVGSGGRPLVVGVTAPQGCGKTTVTNLLEKRLIENGVSCLSLSIDDFYLPAKELAVLADGPNPLFRVRGNAGTHDIPLLMETLNALDELALAPPDNRKSVAIPRFDKSLRKGMGDRIPVSEWKHITESPVVILVEGWMLGFSSVPDSHEWSPEMQEINHALKSYRPLHLRIDAWVVFALPAGCSNLTCLLLEKRANLPPDSPCPCVVYTWRLQAEHKMIQQRGKGMNDDEVKAFVDCYMPAYEHYLSPLYSQGPERRPETPIFMIRVDANRAAITYSRL